MGKYGEGGSINEVLEPYVCEMALFSLAGLNVCKRLTTNPAILWRLAWQRQILRFSGRCVAVYAFLAFSAGHARLQTE